MKDTLTEKQRAKVCKLAHMIAAEVGHPIKITNWNPPAASRKSETGSPDVWCKWCGPRPIMA
jgi:hypothetical protein